MPSSSDNNGKSAEESEIIYFLTFGKIVLIRHENNFISIYGRVAQVRVKKNELVKKGQKIGSMPKEKKDGKNFSILHFELRKGTKSVNPENYLK